MLMLCLLDSPLFATLSLFFSRWHHYCHRHADITGSLYLGRIRVHFLIRSTYYRHWKKKRFTSQSESTNLCPILKSNMRYYERQNNFANLILPSEESPGRVSRLNVKSIPSCTSSACGLRQISSGSDSQQGGWMGRLIWNPLNTQKELRLICGSLHWEYAVKALRIKERYFKKRRKQMIKTDRCQEERGRRTSVLNSLICD